MAYLSSGAAIEPRRSWPSSLRALTLVTLFVAATLVACGGDADEDASRRSGSTAPTLGTQPVPTTTQAPPGFVPTAYVKRTVTSFEVFSSPNATTPSMRLDNPWVVDPRFPDQTVQQVFLVKSQRTDGWVQVLLPIRPNGSTGWVRADDVSIVANPFHITVELGRHRITVTQADNGATKVLYQGPVAVGASDTPTPVGNYYIRVLVKALDPTTVYGPYAYGLSSHSEVLEEFNGGDGEIGIHGNNDASVLGSNVTHGCVRMDNAAITALASQLPLGTPVDIVG